MQNIIHNLDEIFSSVIDIRSKYQLLKQKNYDIEVQLSNLKVEADHYKQEILTLKKELEDKEEFTKHLMTTNTDEPSKSETKSVILDQNDAGNRLKQQIDEFIVDIDQCIQIIQSKE